ncbi:MAG: hypothetical protein AAF790_05240 [Planctomycetota bacterium]
MLAVLPTAAVTLALAVTPPTPQWEADYGKALAQTRSDQRPLLVVIEGGPAASQAAPAAEANAADGLEAYDLCRVSVATEYGQKVAEVFNAKRFPFMAIIDKSGSVILHKQAGVMSEKEWAATLKRYESGERGTARRRASSTARRITVAKPVVNDPVTIQPEPSMVERGYYVDPASALPAYYTPQPGYFGPPADCPNCRRGY